MKNDAPAETEAEVDTIDRRRSSFVFVFDLLLASFRFFVFFFGEIAAKQPKEKRSVRAKSDRQSVDNPIMRRSDRLGRVRPQVIKKTQ